MLIDAQVPLVVVTFIFTFLALVTVVLRIYARIQTPAGFGIDDGLILVSMVLGEKSLSKLIVAN